MDTPTEQVDTGRVIPEDTFAHRLMLARAHAGHISIRVAAEKCGYGRGAWTGWERGMRPSDKLEVAEVVSEQLGVDFEWLLFGGQLTPEAGARPGRTLRRVVRQSSERSTYSVAPAERTGFTPPHQRTSPERPMSPAGHHPGDRPPGRPDAPTAPRQRRTHRIDRPTT